MNMSGCQLQFSICHKNNKSLRSILTWILLIVFTAVNLLSLSKNLSWLLFSNYNFKQLSKNVQKQSLYLDVVQLA